MKTVSQRSSAKLLHERYKLRQLRGRLLHLTGNVFVLKVERLIRCDVKSPIRGLRAKEVLWPIEIEVKSC